MTVVTITSKSLNGLSVIISMQNGEAVNAYFASSGKQLPDKLFKTLTNSIDDMLKATEELERVNGK